MSIESLSRILRAYMPGFQLMHMGVAVTGRQAKDLHG